MPAADADHSPDGTAAIESVVSWWRLLVNWRPLDPAWFAEMGDDAVGMVLAENRRLAVEGRSIGLFAAGVPLDTDEQILAAWDAALSVLREIADVVLDGLCLDSVLECFLAEHGHEPVWRHYRLAILGLRIGLRSTLLVADVIAELLRAAHEPRRAT